MPRVSKMARLSESNRDISTLAEKDSYCWLCHRSQTNKFCSGCIRTYHLKCIKVASTDDPWKCPECKEIEKSDADAIEPFDTESAILMVERAIQLDDFESFVSPICRMNFPDFYDCVVNPISLDQIKQKICDGKYKSLRALLGDVKWINHNISAFFSEDKKYATQGKHLVKLFFDEIESIDKCRECFVNANLHGNWFSMVCSKPHLILWAKFAGFPLWPCKLMCIEGRMAYVRFFGDHKHAKIDIKNCYLYSRVTTRTTKKLLGDALHEADFYIQNLSSALGGIFVYAEVKTPFDPSKLNEYLDNMVIDAIELPVELEASANSSPEKVALSTSNPVMVESPRSSPSRKRKSTETDDQSTSLVEPITSENVSSSSDVKKIDERRKSVQFALERNEYIPIEQNEPIKKLKHSVIKGLSSEMQLPALMSADHMKQVLVVSNTAQQPVPKMMEAVILNQFSDLSYNTAAVISELKPILNEIAASTNWHGMNRTQSVLHADRFNDDINRTRANLQLREMQAKLEEIQKSHANEMENLRANYETKIAAMTTEHNFKLTEMKSKQWCQSCGKEAPSTYCCDRNCHDIFENQLLAEPMNETI